LLAQRGRFQRIILADREQARVQQRAAELGAEAVVIDVTDTDALVALMRRTKVVLNATGPFSQYGLPAVQAAITAGVHYADVNDEVEPIQEVFGTDAMDQAARVAGMTAVVGLGISPGFTNILARYGAQQMDTVTAVHMALTTGPWTRGMAVWAHRIHVNSGLATIYRDGTWQHVPAMSEVEEIGFPWPPGRAQVHIVAHPEPITLPRSFPDIREVVTKLGYPESVNTLLRDCARYGLTAEEGILLYGTAVSPATFLAAYLASEQADQYFGFSTMTPYSSRQVQITGIRDGRDLTLRYQVALPGGAGDTALPLVIAGELLAEGGITEPGVCAPEALDPAPFLTGLASIGAHIRVIREEEPANFGS
jgi:saccharopine dehydrogenase (NAD+, L-lysine-forming)